MSAVSKRLGGKTYLITGASSGIGKATAEELVSQARGESIRLVLGARRKDVLDKLARELASAGSNVEVHTVAMDVGNTGAIDNALASLPDKFAQIDVLVNNAGFVLGNDKVGEIKPEEVASMVGVNVLGLIHLTQKVLPGMLSRGKGDVLNIGSIAGREPYPGGSIYCATKSAVAAFTKSLLKEMISTPVRVMQVDPGQVETEFSVVRMRGDKAKADAIYKGVTPLTPQDIAEAVVFALSRPQNVVIAEQLIFPSHQAGAGASSLYRRPE
ncbi:hypothetical protein PYCC9005_004287 [Savitreella phatthalungensis]